MWKCNGIDKTSAVIKRTEKLGAAVAAMLMFPVKELPPIQSTLLGRAIIFALLFRTIIVVAWITTSLNVGKKPFGTEYCCQHIGIRNEGGILSTALPSHGSNHFQQHAKAIFGRTSVRLSPTTTEDDMLATPENPKAILRVEAYSGLSKEEFAVLVEAVEDAYAETVGLAGVPCETKTDTCRRSSSTSENSSGDDLLIGTLRRVLSLRTNLDEESAENLRALIAERVDYLIYESGELREPVLVSVQTPSKSTEESSMNVDVEDIIRTEIEQYGLRTPIHSSDDQGDALVGDESTMYTPSSRIEIDGAETLIEHSGETFWDTSSVVVFDDLISDDLRERLLDVVKGKPSHGADWNDIENGPDPGRWIRGALRDIPDNEGDGDGEALSCWGLPTEAIEDICFARHEAIEEFESLLTNLFPQFVVSRLPEAVYGESVSPLTANAPVAGEEGLYDFHIDGDPLQTPPSPWTDVYGRYPNRCPGKPRFVSCLVYLNNEWDGSEWGAATKFYDPPTNNSYEVMPRPGRCVILDQDLGHTVTPPKPSAGKRPRYSLVWKLVLHPKIENQNMNDLSYSSSQPSVRSPWPEPSLFGSAARRSQ